MFQEHNKRYIVVPLYICVGRRQRYRCTRARLRRRGQSRTADVRNMYYSIICITCVLLVTHADAASGNSDEPPEGYYAFVESPNATPPRVRPPPYRAWNGGCGSDGAPHVSADNLCGDLNRGLIPQNPMGHPGEPYPFELIRNHTLKYLSRTLPVLRADDTLPRVAHITKEENTQLYNDLSEGSEQAIERDRRSVRDAEEAEDATEEGRDSRKFCDGGGVFCMLYRAINGDSSGAERREDPGVSNTGAAPTTSTRYEGPPTPCPARVEYATPVFARNYQGVWRYVVQIPYEGYFTQTVEVTRCLRARCHYLDGGCLSSPRWLQLLAAELLYANNTATSTASVQCDGRDQLGCYQVRLYYDWFLVPGSCKCWRPDYFSKYVRRNNQP